MKPLYLALSGGGAHAAAHAGVLRALDREGLKVAGIAGTSGGALVAAAWAGGADLDKLVDQASRLHPWTWVRGWGGGLLSGTRLGDEGAHALQPHGLPEQATGFFALEEVTIGLERRLERVVEGTSTALLLLAAAHVAHGPGGASMALTPRGPCFMGAAGPGRLLRGLTAEVAVGRHVPRRAPLRLHACC